MLKHHIKIALRFFGRNKVFTSINILGLAIGITAFLILTQYLSFEKGYDKGMDDVYRVTLSSNIAGDNFEVYATNHPAVGPAMLADFPEVEKYARIVNSKTFGMKAIMSYKNQFGEVIKSSTGAYNTFFADGAILDLFDIPLLQGNPETALKDPLTILFSESLARKLFGNENLVGKEIIVNHTFKCTVNGIFQDLPENSHLAFDILISLSSFGEGPNTTWIWPEFYNYVQLKSGTDPNNVDAKFPAFVQKYLSEIMQEHGFEAKFALQPVGDIHLKSHLQKEISSNSSERTLNFLVIVAAFVICIALINFINLSTAKSMERAKEVGMKKVVGAHRGVLISQFLFESLILNGVAVLIAIMLVCLLMTSFNHLIGHEVLSMGIWSKLGVWIIMLSVLMAGGLLAGIYPAFVLSGFEPVKVLKGKFHYSSNSSFLRKGLVVAQFVVSIALISGTFIVYNQFRYMQNQDLGFRAEQNLVVTAPANVDSTVYQRVILFKNELKQLPNIHSATMTRDVPGKPMIDQNLMRKKEDIKVLQTGTNILSVDHDFLETYKVKLLAGRFFVKEDKARLDFGEQNADPLLHRIVVNASVVKSLGFTNPEEALHKKIVFNYGKPERTAEIIGVIGDYHQQSLQNGYENIILTYPDNYLANFITINMAGNNIHQTISAIESKYKELFPNDPFDYVFLDDYFNQQYKADLKFGLICLLFSGLAIFIAALGLFGLGSHMAMQKVKEISVRKVLGATMLQALILIPKNIMALILISGGIALPIVFFITKKWLESYAFQVGIAAWMFLVPLLIVMIVALLAILTQSVKTAYINPADTLKSE